jgi:hypothetical protein
MASPNGETLSKDKATPFVVNYEMVDTDKDGKISAAEFKTGCGKGWIQKADTSTVKRDEAKAIANFLLMVSRTLRFMGSPSQTPRLGLCSHR